MFKKFLLILALATTAALGALPASAAPDPSMHEIYLAAEGGRYIEAQTMMDQVLKQHPNSAKAHYVQAELQAKQGLLAKADAELRTAERLQPGLAFAKPEAVEKLRAVIAAPRTSLQSTPSSRSAQPSMVNQPAPEKSLPWGLLLGGAALVAFIFVATRFMRQRNQAAMVPAGASAGYGASPGMQPPAGFGRAPTSPTTAPAYGAAPTTGAAPPAAGGIGSGIMGGLATGAAVGAGIVAGQALMHHFTDGDRNSNNLAPKPANDNWNPAPANDMGGTDFGIANNSSWDDGGSNAGSDDWS